MSKDSWSSKIKIYATLLFFVLLAIPFSKQSETTPPPQVNNTETKKENTFLLTRVIDGDTIELQNGQKVRYIGIDTPELTGTNECYGLEAKDFNATLVENKKVRLEKDVSETDKYERLLRYVYVDTVFVNAQLVQNGFANATSYPPDIKYQQQFLNLERQARENNKGLWASCTKKQTTDTTLLPTGCNIKGNISYTTNEKIYHFPGCENYSDTQINTSKGEQWFCTEQEATKAGWRKATNCP